MRCMEGESKPRPLSFDPCFGKLGREIERFANHTNRFLLASNKFRPELLRASQWTEGTAPLDRTPASPMAALRAIDKFARIHRAHRQSLFGSYFAHHHLRTQAELSRTLLRESLRRKPGQRAQLCFEIHARASHERRAWITALLETTLAASSPGLRTEDYAIFNVGALTDHEDVDLAIVVASVEARDLVARGFGGLTKTFLRFASKIQLFLAEQLVNPRAGGLIEEYEEIIEDPFVNVVVVMQLLGAQYLCGSKVLAGRFTERITRRFYAQIGDPILHEGFLRSVATELTHYLDEDHEDERFAPKQQIYIPSRLVIAALRVIHGIHNPHPPQALEELLIRHPHQSDQYRVLKKTFVQNEVLRALIFLYIMKSDEIDLYDPLLLDPTRRVANLLGLRRSARKSADARLVAYYKELRLQNTRSCQALSKQINTHLSRVSTFQASISDTSIEPDNAINFALRFLKSLKQLKRGVFWEEVISHIRNNPDMKHRFFASISELDQENQYDLARQFFVMMSLNATAIMEFLILLGEYNTNQILRMTSVRAPAAVFWKALLGFIEEETDHFSDFLFHFDSETKMEVLFRLANTVPSTGLAELANAIEEKEDGSRSERVVRRLRSIIILTHHHANRLRRLRDRVLLRAPKYVDRLGDPERARKLSQKLKSRAAHEVSYKAQLKILGEAFDISIMNASLNAILDGAPASRDLEYINAFDDYVRSVFKVCFKEMQSRSPMFEKMQPGTGFALYATGGYGRKQGFGSDFDYIAIIGGIDPGKRKFFSKVVQRMESTVLKRGVIPHNRLSNEFNSYVIGFEELRVYLMNRNDQTFVDEAEVLECRFILGDQGLHRVFTEQIVELVLNQNRRHFILDLLAELKDRRSTLPLPINIKFGFGGLREIQLLRLALGALLRVPNADLDQALQSLDGELLSQRANLRFLAVGYAELRRIRDLYRLVIAGKENPMDIYSFIETAKDLPPLQAMGVRPQFEKGIAKLMTSCGNRVDEIAEAIRQELNAEE